MVLTLSFESQSPQIGAAVLPLSPKLALFSRLWRAASPDPRKNAGGAPTVQAPLAGAKQGIPLKTKEISGPANGSVLLFICFSIGGLPKETEETGR